MTEETHMKITGLGIELYESTCREERELT